MGKSRTDRKGFTREQRLVEENRILKRHISALRKELAKLDLDKCYNVKEAIEQCYQDDRAEEGQNIIENLKAEWKCKECDGYLEIFIYSKIGNLWYYRLCSNFPGCKNRTIAKRYDPVKVKGIIKNPK